MIVASPSDFNEAARRKLPRFLFDYLDGGAGEEVTLRRNLSDLSSIVLRQRVLSQVSKVHFGIELLGLKQALPVVLAPIGLTGMYARRGEVQAARAAAGAGIPFCLPTMHAPRSHSEPMELSYRITAAANSLAPDRPRAPCRFATQRRVSVDDDYSAIK